MLMFASGGVARHPRGSDAWWELEPWELLPEGALREEARAGRLVRGGDTLDVWFDSGSSKRNTAGWRTMARPMATRWR